MPINLRKLLGNDITKLFPEYFLHLILEYEHVGGLLNPMVPTRRHHRWLSAVGFNYNPS